MKHAKLTLLICFFVVLILSRFLLLDRSARFIWDESDDLVRMHDIFVNHRITMVGPIAEDNTKIFGSLSYYMLMPFTVASSFDPLGNVYGTAFYGVLTAIALAYVLRRFLKVHTWIALLTPIVLFPLVQSGRWAWNPHFIPFWQILAMIVLYKLNKKWYAWPIAGFIQGLSVHNHWYGIFSSIGVMIALMVLKRKEPKQVLLFISGFLLSLLPFVVFDLTRPPGLFLTRLIYFSPVVSQKIPFSLMTVGSYLVGGVFAFIRLYFQSDLVALMFIAFLLPYVVIAVKNRSRSLLFLIPVTTQILAISLLRQEPYNHYLLPAVFYFVLFLLYKPTCPKLQTIMVIILLIGTTFASYHEIVKNDWSTNITRTKNIANILEKNMTDNCNVFVAASPDPSTQGKKYRDLLSLRGKSFMSKLNYDTNNCLFVISTSSDKVVRKDPAYELNHFRNTNPMKQWVVEDGWRVYLYRY